MNSSITNDDFIYEKIKSFQSILSLFTEAINANKDDISISVQCLIDIIITVEKEKMIFKEFHKMSHVSWCKEVSLYCYYFIRKKPIVIANNAELSMIINEKFCVALILSNLKRDSQENLKFKEYINFLTYQFSHGELTKDSLYLLTKTLDMLMSKEGE